MLGKSGGADFTEALKLREKQAGEDQATQVACIILLSGKVFGFSCLQHFLNPYNLMEKRLKKD